jgi:hypothetical protein
MAIVKHYDIGNNSLATFNNVIFWYISGWELDGGGGLLQFLDGDVAYCLLEDQTLLISK